MKRFKNKLLATALLFTTILFFSSCEDEYYQSRGELDFTTVNDEYPPTTNNRGEFSLTIDFYDTDITGYNPRTESINNFRMYNSWLYFFNKKSFREGDQIDIYFEADGVGTYLTTLYVDRDGYGYTDGGYDKALLNFMANFIDKIVYRGKARLYIYGEVYDYRGVPVQQQLAYDISLENSLDLEIRR